MLVIVGNKTDLIEEEQVSIEEGSSFAKVIKTRRKIGPKNLNRNMELCLS